MYFNDNVRGKIIIDVNKTYDKLNSNIEFKGMARDKETALGALLIHFAELALQLEKDPQELLSKNIDAIVERRKKGGRS